MGSKPPRSFKLSTHASFFLSHLVFPTFPVDLTCPILSGGAAAAGVEQAGPLYPRPAITSGLVHGGRRTATELQACYEAIREMIGLPTRNNSRLCSRFAVACWKIPGVAKTNSLFNRSMKEGLLFPTACHKGASNQGAAARWTSGPGSARGAEVYRV